MQSQITHLESDIRTLCDKVRRISPDIKKAGEHALRTLRPLHESTDDKVISEGIGSETVLRPFLLACGIKETGIVLLALNTIQSLLSLGVLDETLVAQVVGTLRIQAETKDESIQLRILQTLSLATAPEHQQGNASLPQALSICLRLLDSESQTIASTAAASLQRTVGQFFDTASSFHPLEDGFDHLPITVQTAYFLLSDFCLMLIGEKPQWLVIASKTPQALVAELIEGILEGYSDFIAENLIFAELVRNQLFPFVDELLRLATDFPFVLRLTRVGILLVKHFNKTLPKQVDSFVSLLTRFIGSKVTWRQSLAFEGVVDVSAFLLQVHLYNEQTFASLCESISSFIQYNRNFTIQTVTKPRVLDLMGESASPSVSEEVTVWKSAISLCSIVSSVRSVGKEGESMVSVLWKPLLPVVAILMKKSDSPLLFDCLRDFSFVCAEFGIDMGLKQCLQVIQGVLSEISSPLSSKERLAFAVLRELAVLLREHLSSQWELLLDPFERLALTSKDDLVLQNVFAQCTPVSHTAMSHLMRHVGTILMSELAAAATSTLQSDSHIFALSCIEQLFIGNPTLLPSFWSVLMDQLSITVNHKEKMVRLGGIRTISVLFPMVLCHSNDICKVLDPFLILFDSRYAETRKCVLESLLESVQSQSMQETALFPFLQSISSKCTADDLKIAFKVVQTVTDELFRLTQSTLADLIPTIGAFALQTTDSNISFASIGLLWQISDFSIANHKFQLNALIFTVLSQISLDWRAEVRNSAVQTLHSTVYSYAQAVPSESVAVTTEILIPLLRNALGDGRDSSVASAGALGQDKSTGERVMMLTHHSRDTAEKQWDETRVHVVEGISRLFRQLSAEFVTDDAFSRLWTELMGLMEICAVQEGMVARAALKAVQEMVQRCGSRKAFDQGIAVFSFVVGRRRSGVPCDTLIAVLENAAILAHSEICQSKDVLHFLAIADDLANDPPETGTPSNRETALQRATLELIRELERMEVPHNVWNSVLSQVAGYVSAPLSKKSGLSLFSFATSAVSVLQHLYCEKSPLDVRMDPIAFEIVITPFITILNAQPDPQSLSLCQTSIPSLFAVLQQGVGSATLLQWNSLNVALSHFVTANCDIQMQIEVLDGIGTVLIPLSHSATDEVRLSLLRILDFSFENVQLTEKAIALLFQLTGDPICGRLANTVLELRCARVIGDFLMDEGVSGKRPLPLKRRIEVYSLMRMLSLKEYQNLLKYFMPRLFPVLCECITVKDEGLRECLQDVFLSIAEMRLHDPSG